MSSLVDFLLERIAEDERCVYEADSDGEYRATWVTIRNPDGSMRYTTVASDHRGGDWCADGNNLMEEYPGATADEPFFDARRVLADCTARRRIIEAANGWRHEVVEDCWYTCPAATEDVDGGECCDDARRGTACDCGRDRRVAVVLSALASVYADHPDFDPGWGITE
jgi:hypothetical protein